MPSQVSESIYQALSAIRLIDPHTHINPHDPASHTLADLLGYHYYTELAHSAGMPKSHIEDRSIGPKELVSRLVQGLPAIENTAQYRWLIELCRNFYGFDSDRIDASNWEGLYDLAEDRMRAADWPQMVLEQSNVEAVFLTNDFDDKLMGFDTDVYIPCLRTDELVFHLHKRTVQQRLTEATGVELDGSLITLREALTRRFEHFVSHGARACAISLPPGFTPTRVNDGRAASALDDVLRRTDQADPAHRDALSRRVFWTLAELCDEFGLPFDLMIGVNRGVYADGVYQGQDLYDSRVSLIQYRELFNAFPNVKFPISVLASVTNQELVSYAWIFPNVITNGHWWYSNTPSFIARDAAVRLEAVPQTKQIAYYSDAYKLEFVWPKFDMYRRTLADLLADNFVGRNGWNEERAIELGRQVLRNNVDEIFPRPDTSKIRQAMDREESDTLDPSSADPDSAVLMGTAAAGFAGAALATNELLSADLGDADQVDTVDEMEDVEFDDNATLVDSTTVAEEPESPTTDSGSVDAEPKAFSLDDDSEASEEFATLMLEPGSPLPDDGVLTEEAANIAAQWETADETDAADSDSAGAGTDSLETVVENGEDIDEFDFSDELGSSSDVTEEASSAADVADETINYETLMPGFDDLDATDVEIKAVKPIAFNPLEETVDLKASPEEPQMTSNSSDDISSLEDDFGDELQLQSDTTGALDTIVDESAEVESAEVESAEVDADDTKWPIDAPDDVPEPLDLDAVPSDDEVQSLPLSDVVLHDYAAELVGLDAEKIDSEVDPEPLDVGDLTIEDEPSDAESPEIRMLRGEESFSPDEDSLQMKSNPTTGELVFPVDSDEDLQGFASVESESDDLASELDADADEWVIDDDDVEDVTNETFASEDVATEGKPAAESPDDDDWFADLSDLMGDDDSKSESTEEDKS